MAALRRAGFHAVSLAGNHIADCGAEGIADTIARARRSSASRTAGAGADLARRAQPALHRQSRPRASRCSATTASVRKTAWATPTRAGCAYLRVDTADGVRRHSARAAGSRPTADRSPDGRGHTGRARTRAGSSSSRCTRASCTRPRGWRLTSAPSRSGARCRRGRRRRPSCAHPARHRDVSRQADFSRPRQRLRRHARAESRHGPSGARRVGAAAARAVRLRARSARTTSRPFIRRRSIGARHACAGMPTASRGRHSSRFTSSRPAGRGACPTAEAAGRCATSSRSASRPVCRHFRSSYQDGHAWIDEVRPCSARAARCSTSVRLGCWP